MTARFHIARAGFRLGAVVLGLAIFALLAPLNAAEDEPEVVLTRPVAFTNAFGGKETKFRVAIRAKNRATGRLLWSLASADRLVLLRGELPADIAAGEPQELEFTLALLPVKPGVIFPALLTTSLLRDGDREAVARLETPLWLFPEDPFFDREKWLAELKLTLFDPPGKTAERLKEAKLPFEQVHNIAALESLTAGILIVGEGVSLREERALPEIMLALARKGVPVLCLALVDGELAVPTRRDAPQAPPSDLHFRRQEVVRQLDKRLDAEFWMAERVQPAHSLDLAADGSQVVVQVAEGAAGWPWVELQFPGKAPADPATRFVITSLPLVKHWESGPAPRFLFVRILEHLAPADSTTSAPSAIKETVSP